VPRKSEVPSKIIRAAIVLFSRQGYHRTTTDQIARLADVSEVTLYRYFERKEDVFWSALASAFEVAKSRIEGVEANSRSSAPEVVLPRLMTVLIDTATFSPELVRLLTVALVEVRGKAEQVCRDHLTPVFTAISTYLDGTIAAGSIRNLNPVIMTVAIVLSALAQPEISKLIEGCQLSKMNHREAVEAYTQFWLDAMAPDLQKPSAAPGSAPNEPTNFPS
jgi:AcrR family transcriptional regulator